MKRFSGPRVNSGGYFSGAKISLWLAIVMASFFILDTILRVGDLSALAQFNVEQAVFRGQVWRFFTFPWFHASGGQLFGNLLFLLVQ